MSDPFTDAYEALWGCLEARSGFTDLVKAANRVKFTGTDRDPMERLAACKSFPAVAILPAARPESESRIDCDSDTTDVEKWFQVVIAAGDQRLTYIHAVEFEVLRAFAAWRTTVGAVTWNDEACVLDCALYAHTAELDRKLVERGIRGWSVLWSGRLWFSFTTADLAAE